jgi:hypothetical protein
LISILCKNETALPPGGGLRGGLGKRQKTQQKNSISSGKKEEKFKESNKK